MNPQLIQIEQARAGMVLAGDLRDAGGGVLLPDGAILSDANLQSLRRRGITACSIAPETPVEDAAARALRLERMRQRLTQLFRRSAGEQATPLLMQLLLTYRENG